MSCFVTHFHDKDKQKSSFTPLSMTLRQPEENILGKKSRTYFSSVAISCTVQEHTIKIFCKLYLNFSEEKINITIDMLFLTSTRGCF